ncbi:alkaline shock response membrane anchor protein AmaP [Saccharothrix sp. HUAS TT1]|uniref:alkaline shock response membrane anchor protein AmaP n=1 Tax=unclassified Saccharothrix TaxID=2593673 RepID=UPI00345B95A7
MNRSNRTERVLAFTLGTLALLVGGGAVVLNRLGVDRPLADPVALDWVRSHLLPVRVGLLALGVLAVFLGLLWAWRAVRPERRPDLRVGDDVVVTAKALAAAVKSDAEHVRDVDSAKVAVVGTPALRLRLVLRHGADVPRVWRELDGLVLSRARDALDVEVLPTAVRLELAKRERVRRGGSPGRMAGWRSR